MLRLDQRRRGDEIMDSPDLDEGLHRHALAGLGRINRLSRTAAMVWPEIRALAERRSGETLRILDVACGGGDIAVSLARRAAHEGYQIHVDGIDISPFAVRHATEKAAAAGVARVRFFTGNVLTDSFAQRYHAVLCSLFLHHLDESDAAELLVRMRQTAQALVLVSDLRRCRSGYWLAQVVCRTVTTSHVVHFDGPLSVASAFTEAELAALAQRSGMAGAVIRRCWPQRLLLVWRRP